MSLVSILNVLIKISLFSVNKPCCRVLLCSQFSSSAGITIAGLLAVHTRVKLLLSLELGQDAFRTEMESGEMVKFLIVGSTLKSIQ